MFPQCLTPVFACRGLDITTIEGLGNRKDGYNEIQKRLVRHNGTQCGYCSPGMVMNMFGLLEANEGRVTMEQVERSFGGNICRCTGYRPILDAFKSMAVDAEPCRSVSCLSNGGADIEDLPYKCASAGDTRGQLCHKGWNMPSRMEFRNGTVWATVFSMEELFSVFDSIGNRKYMLVGGNTAHGVYRRDMDIEVFVQVNSVFARLCPYQIEDSQIVLASSLSLSRAMEILKTASAQPQFSYCEQLVQHIDLIANVPVRNVRKEAILLNT